MSLIAACLNKFICDILPGLCPEPYFILWLDPKNEAYFGKLSNQEKSRQNNPPRALPHGKNFKQTVASSFVEILCHTAFTASSPPRFVMASPRCF